MNRRTIVFLVALRLAIGWHFLYEGIWKTDSDKGSASYATSWYPLQTSVARLRAAPAERADAWYDEIVKTFKGRNRPLAEDQKARLAGLRDQVKLGAAAGDVVNFDWIYVRDEVLRIPPEPPGERFTSLPYLQASPGPFRGLFRGLVRDIDGLERLTTASAQIALDRRCAEVARHFGFTAEQRTRLEQARDTLKQEIAITLDDPGFRARLADYRAMRARVAADPRSLHAPFTRERILADRQKLDDIAGELLAYVGEPLTELVVQAQAIATVGQLGAGPPPRPGEPAAWIDWTMRWGLTAIGLCLLLGLFTPVAAAAAALQLAMFYLASPPWPGLPAATLGGHYLYVDRNLIELIAACVIATTGTGRLAGLDAYLRRTLVRGTAPLRPRLAAQEPVRSAL